jgi:hypothetical protein
MKKILFILGILIISTSLAMADEIVVTINTEEVQKVEILTYKTDIDEIPTGRYKYYEEGSLEYRIDAKEDRCVAVFVEPAHFHTLTYQIALCVSNIDKGISVRVQGIQLVTCILRWGEEEN